MDQDSPWLAMLDIALPGGEHLYLVNNTDDVVFQGQTYSAFAFNYEQQKQTSKGEIPTVTISVSNVSRVIQSYVEQYDGGIGSTVTLIIVNHAHLTEDYAELTADFTVLGSKCTAQWVSFTLGAPNPLNKRFPAWQYIALHCRFKFNYPAGTGPYCGYSGTATTCSRTLDNCRALGNSTRFGGHPGLDGRGIRIV
jgi:phage-related protein